MVADLVNCQLNMPVLAAADPGDFLGLGLGRQNWIHVAGKLFSTLTFIEIENFYETAQYFAGRVVQIQT